MSRKEIYRGTLTELKRVRSVADELDSAISTTRDTHSSLRENIESNEKTIDETAKKQTKESKENAVLIEKLSKVTKKRGELREKVHELEKKVCAQKKVVKILEGERNVTFEKYTGEAQDVCELVDKHRFLMMTLENKLHG